MKHHTYTYKAAAALLMAAMLAPLLYVAFHLASVATHKVHMRKVLKYSMLQTITLDSASITWAEYDREILVNGDYFDVEHIEFANGKATVTGLYDEQEAILYQQLREAQNSAPGYAWQTGQVAKWLLTLWEPATAHQLPAHNMFSVSAAHNFCAMLPDCHRGTPDRPPQDCLLG